MIQHSRLGTATLGREVVSVAQRAGFEAQNGMDTESQVFRPCIVGFISAVANECVDGGAVFGVKDE